jgi:protein-L-isoaspartate(D-aspartate) O-methyltransferase
MDQLDKVFNKISRTDFLPDSEKDRAHLDIPIQIGFGQTNSQPTTVHRMLEWLDPQPGEKVLDVGSGSGWTTALLATLVGSNGQVYAVEKIPELVEFGKGHCRNIGIKNADFYKAGDIFGLPEYAPYDRILVSASTLELPQELLLQLKAGGRIVIPIGNSIMVIDKIDEENYETREHRGYVFVPLVKS